MLAAPPVLASSLIRSSGFFDSPGLDIEGEDMSGGGEEAAEKLLAAETRLPRPGIRDNCSGVRLPSRGPRKCGKPAAAAHWNGYFGALSSNFGIFGAGPPSRNDPTVGLLLPERSRGDSAELLSRLGEESGDLLDRFRTPFPPEAGSSPEENFLFLDSSELMEPADICCKPD